MKIRNCIYGVFSLFAVLLNTACEGFAELLSEETETAWNQSHGEEDKNHLLTVSRSEENLLLTYDTLTFTAQLNWEDGNYYFTPDPDGSITGHKTVCLVGLSHDSLEGKCFRDRHVCEFSYWASFRPSMAEDVFELESTTCKIAGKVGPFLVPLEAPLCGQDPYPACTDMADFWPTGFDSEEGLSPVIPQIPTTPVIGIPITSSLPGPNANDDVLHPLIPALCEAVHRCDPSWTVAGCMQETGDTIQGVPAPLATLGCIHELAEICDNRGEEMFFASDQDMAALLPTTYACGPVLSLN